jgi:hypothetical protein
VIASRIPHAPAALLSIPLIHDLSMSLLPDCPTDLSFGQMLVKSLG